MAGHSVEGTQPGEAYTLEFDCTHSTLYHFPSALKEHCALRAADAKADARLGVIASVNRGQNRLHLQTEYENSLTYSLPARLGRA